MRPDLTLAPLSQTPQLLLRMGVGILQQSSSSHGSPRGWILRGPPQSPGLIPQSSFTHHTVYFLHPFVSPPPPLDDGACEALASPACVLKTQPLNCFPEPKTSTLGFYSAHRMILRVVCCSFLFLLIKEVCAHYKNSWGQRYTVPVSFPS